MPDVSSSHGRLEWARLISCFGSSWSGNGFSGLFGAFRTSSFFTFLVLLLGLLLFDRHV